MLCYKLLQSHGISAAAIFGLSSTYSNNHCGIRIIQKPVTSNALYLESYQEVSRMMPLALADKTDPHVAMGHHGSRREPSLALNLEMRYSSGGLGST